tara:strand:- start:30786 stop:31022 length:237 start_codon:yes stop_codon:yes gene_type:complete
MTTARQVHNRIEQLELKIKEVKSWAVLGDEITRRRTIKKLESRLGAFNEALSSLQQALLNLAIVEEAIADLMEQNYEL